MLKTNLDQIQQRTRQYWYIDGLNEIGFGLFLMLFAAYFYLAAITPDGSPLAAILSGGFVLVILAGATLLNWGVKWGKQRLTFPRTGYVNFERSHNIQRRLFAGGLAMMISASVVILVRLNQVDFLITVALNGLIYGCVWLYFAWKIGLPRFYVLAGVGLITGIGLAFSNLAENYALALFYLLMAFALLLSGGYTLWVYLRHAPPIQEADDEQ